MRAPDEHPADPRRLGLILAAAQSGQGLRVCMCCGEWLGLMAGVEPGAVSHGLCEPLCRPEIDFYGSPGYLWEGADFGGAMSQPLPAEVAA